MMGQLWNFKVFADEKIPFVIERFEREVGRLFGVLDRAFAERAYLAGNRFGIADVMTWPWINVHPKLGLKLDGHPNLRRWYDTVAARPAVVRGLRVPQLLECEAA